MQRRNGNDYRIKLKIHTELPAREAASCRAMRDVDVLMAHCRCLVSVRLAARERMQRLETSCQMNLIGQAVEAVSRA